LIRTLPLFLFLSLLLQQLRPGLHGLQKPSLQPHHLPQNPNQLLFDLGPIGLEHTQGPSHSLHGANAPGERLLPQNQFGVINASAANTLIHAQTNPSGELGEEVLAGPHHLARVLPRGVEGDEDEVGGGAHGGDVERGGCGGGGGGEEVERGGRAVEDWGEAATEAAGGDGGGAEEGLVEDWSGGELVACLVRVLNDEDARGGLDRRKGKRVAETDARGTIAVGANGTTLRLR